MNQKMLSEICKNKDQVLFVKFTSLKRTICFLPNHITLIRQGKYASKDFYPPKFQAEFIEFRAWINESWIPIKASYNDIACIVIHNLPILSTIHTLEDWKNSEDMIFKSLEDFSTDLRAL